MRGCHWKDHLNIFLEMFLNHLLEKPEICYVLGFNDMSTLVGHFVLSPREREKRNRRDSREDEREGMGERKMNDSKETKEIKHSPSTLTCCKDSRSYPTANQYQLDAPVT